MNTKKSQTVIGVVVVLIILVVLFFYVMLHSENANGSSFSLSQYLNGLAQAALDKEATSTPMAMATSTATQTSSMVVTTAAPARVVPVARPYITVLTPNHGPSGLTVVIGGANFDPAVNYITFGPSSGLHSINGLPDNVVAAEGSLNGKTLTFNVPLDAPDGLQCDSTGKNCTAVSPTVLPAGSYAVTVKTNAGVSNQLYFTLVR